MQFQSSGEPDREVAATYDECFEVVLSELWTELERLLASEGRKVHPSSAADVNNFMEMVAQSPIEKNEGGSMATNQPAAEPVLPTMELFHWWLLTALLVNSALVIALVVLIRWCCEYIVF